MEIKILGGCCNTCDVLLKNTQEVLKELKKEAKVEKVTNFVEIAKYGILKTPGFVLDGKVIFSGRSADKEELKKILSK
ncbi:thioredoxin family protein [Cetobacterium sp. SF1]|uniref:thioredoxin family protein n=1 Tax=Cetobacterium sp. SF1 TaxID=3417654 RepID=UPI003CF1347C